MPTLKKEVLTKATTLLSELSALDTIIGSNELQIATCDKKVNIVLKNDKTTKATYEKLAAILQRFRAIYADECISLEALGIEFSEDELALIRGTATAKK